MAGASWSSYVVIAIWVLNLTTCNTLQKSEQPEPQFDSNTELTRSTGGSCADACLHSCQRPLSHTLCLGQCTNTDTTGTTRLAKDCFLLDTAHIDTKRPPVTGDSYQTKEVRRPPNPIATVFPRSRLHPAGVESRRRRVKRSPKLVLCLNLCSQCITVYGSRNYNGNFCARACVLSQGRSLDPDCENPSYYSVW